MIVDELALRALELIQEACNAKGDDVVVSVDTHLGDLGVDSLKLIEIIFQLETMFSVASDEDLLAELRTVGDIVNMLAKSFEIPAAATS